MRGRRPEPEAVRSQKAAVRSTRRRRESVPLAAVSAGGIEPPRWLDDDALPLWDKLAPTLREAKLLTAADTETFGRYCRNFARWLKMQQLIDAEGESYESESQWGRLKRINPAFLIADRLERQLLAAEDRFGLNPAERQRIFAARAQTGVSGDLFASIPKRSDERPGDPAAPALTPAEPIVSPIGLLN
jgi:P27 family predicted phage terminase small subunit